MIRYLSIALLFLSCLSASCGSKATAGGDILTLDIEAAIDNPKTFDLYEIAQEIEFVPLDDSRRESLVGSIKSMEESKTGFYIMGNPSDKISVKRFDRKGKFLSTRGMIGRGQDEFLYIDKMAVNYEKDNIYLSGSTGSKLPPVIAYNISGDIFSRSDSVLGDRAVCFEDKFIVSQNSPFDYFSSDPASAVGSKVPLLEVYSSNLRHERSVSVVDKGTGKSVLAHDTGGGFNVFTSSPCLISSNGKSLLVKEERSDTVFYYRSGVLEPAYVLDFGEYAASSEIFGRIGSISLAANTNIYMLQNMYEGDRWIVILLRNGLFGETRYLVCDVRDPVGGFSAVGADGKPGFFIDGIPFKPCYIRDNRLVGYIQALDIYDNREVITDPDLKAIAVSIKEESNPVIVVAKL